MEKRRRAVAALAAGAVAVALGAGAARCAASRADKADPTDNGSVTAAWVDAADGQGSDSGASAEEARQSCAEELESREWMGAEDASLRMTASGGRLVETDGCVPSSRFEPAASLFSEPLRHDS